MQRSHSHPTRFFAVATILFVAIVIAQPAPAAPATTQAAPASWGPPLASAQFGSIESLATRDGYVVWLERKLEERTRQNRAQSFWTRIYRTKLPREDDAGAAADARDVEVVAEPSFASTGSLTYVLGPAGAVAWASVGGRLSYSRPGQATIELPRDRSDRSSDEPLLLDDRRLLCQSTHGVAEGLILIPIENGVPRPDARHTFIPWQDAERADAKIAGDLFTHGNLLAVAQRPKDQWSPEHYSTAIWDLTTYKPLRTVPGCPIGLDGKFVYTLDGMSPYHRFDRLTKRPLDPKLEPTPVTLPWPAWQLLDAAPPRLIAMRDQDQPRRFIATGFDLATTTQCDYDLSVDVRPGRAHLILSRPNWRHTASTFLHGDAERRFLLAADAANSVLLAATEDAVYRVPRTAAHRP